MSASHVPFSASVAWWPVVIGLACGISVALLTWLMMRAIATVPHEDRAYKDPPPLGFRLVWMPVQWISHHLDPHISLKHRTIVQGRLRQAGMDYCLSVSQYLAGRIVCACACAGVGAWAVLALRGAAPANGSAPSAPYAQAMLLCALGGWFYPWIWLRDRSAVRRRALIKALPFFLDIITLCVEAGLNIQGAMNQAVNKGPKGALRDEIQRVLRDIRAGKSRAVALRDLADRLTEPSVTHFTTAVIQAESMGMNLGPVLRAQADQRRTERFLRAEKLAMEAPVKMLFPLIAFIFPCTFIVLFFPIVMKFLHAGL